MPRALIIDDSPLAAELLKGAVSAAGIECDVATQLSDLDQALSRAEYDVLLVDVNMPEMYGDDVVEFLRQQRGIKGRLLLYSDIPEEELEQKARTSGADGFVTKSSGLEAAVGAIRDALAPTKPKRLLVVEANAALLQTLKSAPSMAHFEFNSAGSTEAAMKVILKKKTRPDAVLIDLDTPGLGPHELCELLKGNELFRTIPVFVIGTRPMPSLIAEAEALGADQAFSRDDTLVSALTTKLRA